MSNKLKPDAARQARLLRSQQRAESTAARVYTAAQLLRQETMLVTMLAMMLALLALAYCLPRGMLLLYGDAVAHLHIARRLTDSLYPGFRQLGSVWLPFPHLLIAPFATKLAWWQSGLAGTPPSMVAYVLGTVGIYRLARLWLAPRAAAVTVIFYALNPGLLYMQTTAMNEPVFLAEMIWGALLVAEHARALRDDEQTRAKHLLLGAALVFAAAVFTRYDGWIYAAVAWCIVAFQTFRTGSFRKASGGAFVLFTAILLAAPLAWLCYNARQFHDPLDFMRGPYSAKAIAERTTKPGSSPYPGWHSMRVAAMYFLKAAELGAAPVRWANVLLWAAIGGTACAVWKRTGWGILLLLWVPLPFYAYSVAYGSVPIFIPLWTPYSYYNTRYGMELLPAFALSLGFLVAAGSQWLDAHRPKFTAAAVGIVVLLLALNDVTLMRARPLVLSEAMSNSRTRIPFEQALARALQVLPVNGTILMYTSDHVGAVERAGIPLRRTINDSDYLVWNAALAHPAQAAQYAVAIEGDAVAKAIAAHPQGLALLDVVCSTGQPCARLYRSEAVVQPAAGSGSISTK